MARIRNIKPEFFQHDELYDLGEQVGCGAVIFLVYQGLWCQADCQGLFQWKPTRLKLNTVPFYPVDMPAILDALDEEGFVVRYEVDGKSYGWIPTFATHQRISTNELDSGPKFPEPIGVEGYTPWACPFHAKGKPCKFHSEPGNVPKHDSGSAEVVPEHDSGRAQEQLESCPGSLDLGLRTQDSGLRGGGGNAQAREAEPPPPSAAPHPEEIPGLPVMPDWRQVWFDIRGSPYVVTHFDEEDARKLAAQLQTDGVDRDWLLRAMAYAVHKGCDSFKAFRQGLSGHLAKTALARPSPADSASEKRWRKEEREHDETVAPADVVDGLVDGWRKKMGTAS